MPIAVCRVLAQVLLLLVIMTAQTKATEHLDQVQEREQAGKFSEAKALLHSALEHCSECDERDELLFELDRLRRIQRDFSLTREELLKGVQASVKDVTREEIESWIEEGRFDSREIDGVRYFMRSAVRNLFYRFPELDARRTPPKDDVAIQRAHLAVCREIHAAAVEKEMPYVLPKRFDVNFTATVKSDSIPDGSLIRAWLPIPRAFPFQRDFELISNSSSPSSIAPPESSIRSIYFEQKAQSGQETVFETHFRFTHDGVFFDIDASKVTPFNSRGGEVARFLEEGPHVAFTPELRKLSAEIVGDEKNPAIAARKIYDWIGKNIRYSLSIEYSTIRNLSEYCRANGFGDCGQDGMLFIALCRLNGIPARWQSGWNLFPNANNIHDWTEIYLEPYGWVPVDPYMSLYANQYATDLSASERQEIADFYFGGLDQYRMECNSDHSQPLTPAKMSARSDTIDFQRGEFEFVTAGEFKNIYYDEFTWKFNVKELPDASKSTEPK